MMLKSILTALLILPAAVLSNPAPDEPSSSPSAFPTKSSKNSSNLRSSETSKTTKCSKASCIVIDLDAEFNFDREDKAFSFGNGISDNANPIETEPMAVGSTWIQHGDVMDPNGDFGNEDYFYYHQCTVLEGYIKYKSDPSKTRLKNEKIECNIDICIGESDAGVPDCVFLRGLTKANFRASDGGFFNGPDSFYTTIIGGLGKFEGAIGHAEVFIGLNPGSRVELDAYAVVVEDK